MKRLFKRKKAELSVTGISDQPEGDGAGGSVPSSAQGPGAGQPVLARAIADYSSEDPDDLTFRAGQVIEVTDPGEGPESWWEGRLDGREGCFPGTFVMVRACCCSRPPLGRRCCHSAPRGWRVGGLPPALLALAGVPTNSSVVPTSLLSPRCS